MVKLVPMEQADFSAYLQRGIAEYAEDKVSSGNWPAEEALERSRKDFEKHLPDGLHSKNQYIFSIVDGTDAQKLGILWVEVKMDPPHSEAFIFDFIIEKQFRGKGYGKQALAALDEKLISMNVESVGLHVFGHNIVAQELYLTRSQIALFERVEIAKLARNEDRICELSWFRPGTLKLLL